MTRRAWWEGEVSIAPACCAVGVATLVIGAIVVLLVWP